MGVGSEGSPVPPAWSQGHRSENIPPSLTQFSAEAFLMQTLEHGQEFQPFWKGSALSTCQPASPEVWAGRQGMRKGGCCCSSFSPLSFQQTEPVPVACGIGDDCVGSV